MTRGQRKFLTSVIAIAIAVLIVVGVARRWKPTTKPTDTQPTTAPTAATGPATRPVALPVAPVRRPPTITQRADAVVLMLRGLSLTEAGKLVEARTALADALNSGVLSPTQAESAQAKLAAVVDATLFSTQRFENDPSVVWHKFAPGDMLINVERQLKLRVPTQLLLKINGIADAAKIQAGQTVKCIRGPFHAAVSKSRFIMDVYLEEPNTQRMIFAKRFRVGIGQDGSTPTGRWRVARGAKMKKAPWTPPPSSGLPPRKILHGEPGYPLGSEGYWISLEGIGQNRHTAADGYGIHGTGDRDSIGRASSMGCIRLADEDMEEVFSLLYEHWSTVVVRE